MLDALVSTFRSPVRAIAALLIACLTLAAATLLPNAALLRIVLTDPGVPLGRALQIAVSLTGSLLTNFTPLAASYTVLAALLIGINAVLTYRLVSRARSIGGGATTSGLLGLVSGIFGIGCAACGSVLLSATVGTVFGAGFLALLPLKGQEAGILGVALLSAATYALVRRLSEPLACTPTTHQPSLT